MKKIALIFILAVSFCAHNLSAQFRWGPTLGGNYSGLEFSQKLFDTNKHIGIQAGVMCEMMFPGIGFGIDFGAMYQTRGATMYLGQKHIWEADGFGKESLTGHFLTIPIDLRFKWTRMNGIEDYIAPYVFGGPVFGFQFAHTDINAFKYKTLDLGLQAGFGVQLFKRWQIQASYVWGMTDAVRARKLDDFKGSYDYWSVQLIRYF